MEISHMSGAGNTFVVLDARGKGLDLSAMAKKLCHQTGSDGLMAVDFSDTADFRLHFYNADGTRGEMCGNGARCICKYAYDHGIASEHMQVQTDAGMLTATPLEENRYRVQMQLPSVVDLHRLENASYVELGEPGVPHGIVYFPGLSFEKKEALRSLGVALRHDPAFPKGANINFYDWVDEKTLKVLTYERYVEDFTLACGTGCCSVAAVLLKKGQLTQNQLHCQVPGGQLQVTLQTQDNKLKAIFLEGPAVVLDTFSI